MSAVNPIFSRFLATLAPPPRALGQRYRELVADLLEREPITMYCSVDDLPPLTGDEYRLALHALSDNPAVMKAVLETLVADVVNERERFDENQLALALAPDPDHAAEDRDAANGTRHGMR